MPTIPPSKVDKFPDRLPIPQLKQFTAPTKLVFVAITTQRVDTDDHHYKRVMVKGFAKYWRREKRKSKELEEEYAFDNAYDFFVWLAGKVNKRETLYVYSHDLTTDVLSLDGFRQFPVQGFTLRSIYHRLTTTIIKFTDDNRRVTLLDVQNYYPIKLSKLAGSFGCTITDEAGQGANEFEQENWLRDKVNLIQSVMRHLIKETVDSKRGSLRMTSGSTAQSIYRASYMKHKIITNHNPEVVAFEKASFVGGYTGLYKVVEGGNPDLYKVDVNAMYPSVMLDQSYPYQMVEFAPGIPVKMLERYLKGYLVVANVTLNARSAVYPVKHFESSVYPLGQFNTTLSTASLQRALSNDEIISVNRVGVYMGAPIFSDFVRDVYGRRMIAREQGNTADELLHKMVSNTLYGKFGQMQTESTVIGEAAIDDFSVMDAYDPETNTSWVEMHAGGSVLFIYKKNETRYTSFAIASHITDYARLKLFELIEKAGRENVYYCDTDSMVVNAEGIHNLYPYINHNAIGLLKLEEVAPFFIGFAKKDYIFGDTRKLKGFDANMRRLDDNVFEMYQKISFTGAMTRKLGRGAYWQAVNKFYNPFVVNEHLTDDGTVKPLTMPNEFELLGVKTYTMKRIKEIAGRLLPINRLPDVAQWLRL